MRLLGCVVAAIATLEFCIGAFMADQYRIRETTP